MKASERVLQPALVRACSLNSSFQPGQRSSRREASVSRVKSVSRTWCLLLAGAMLLPAGCMGALETGAAEAPSGITSSSGGGEAALAATGHGSRPFALVYGSQHE